MSNASNNLQNLFQSCILSEPSKRLKREYVRFKIIEEIDVFIQKQDNNISSNQDQIAQFIYEFILILQNYPKLIKTINRNLDNFGYLIKRHLYPTPDLKKTYDKIYSDIDIFLFSELKDSESLFRLSSFSIKKFKSLKYLILAADQNHIQAQCNLGSIYYNDIFFEMKINQFII
ncbi:hypothetical protein M9Y10_045530 [Tritrichomonas musculus]|uniref:Uncharacterized protein n=1 Tax=Tritrichomonas musculus TaxID=1915356 RepID=A0ABR2JVV2_9EUKA